MRSALRTITLIAIFTTPSLAAAQTLDRPIEAGQRVWVTDVKGFELKGQIVISTPDAVELSTSGGVRRLAMRDIQLIEKKDSNKNGFWIGFAIGASPVIALGGADAFRSSIALTFMTVGGLTYGGVGWLIDNAIEGRDVLFSREESHTEVHVAPIVGLGESKRLGVGGSITWR